VLHPCLCVRCSAELEPAQEFRFLVESDNLDNPDYLASIRRLPAINGRPLPVCLECQPIVAAISPRPVRKTTRLGTGLLATFGIFAIGLIVHGLLIGACEG
jgi:hypothetical protein